MPTHATEASDCTTLNVKRSRGFRIDLPTGLLQLIKTTVATWRHSRREKHRRSRSAKLRMHEQLEMRLAFDVKWDFVAWGGLEQRITPEYFNGSWKNNGASLSGDWNVAGLASAYNQPLADGQQVKILGRLGYSWDVSDDISLSMNYPGGNLSLTKGGDAWTSPILPKDGSVKLDISLGHPEDSYFDVQLYKQRLSNLSALTPQIEKEGVVFKDEDNYVSKNGDVSYGYSISGDSDVMYRGWVTVDVYLAKGPTKADALLGIKLGEHNLKAEPGTKERFHVSAADVRKYADKGMTYLVTVIDKDNKAAEYDETEGDNVKAIKLPDISFSSVVVNDDHTIRYDYQVSGAAPQFLARPDIELWFADSTGKKLELVPGNRKEVDLTTSEMQSGQTLKTVFDKIPNGATKILAILDPKENAVAPESNEGNNTRLVAIPKSILQADFKITGLTFTAQDEVKITYSVNRGQLSEKVKARVTLYWLANDDSLTRAYSSKTIDIGSGTGPVTGSLTVSPGQLGATWNGEKSLLAEVDAVNSGYYDDINFTSMQLALAKSKTANVLANTDLKYMLLPGPAPLALRISQWLSQDNVAAALKLASDQFKVSKPAIAEAFVYAAMATTAPNRQALAGLDLDSYDVFAVEKQAANNFGRGISGFDDKQLAKDRAAFIGFQSQVNEVRYVETAAKYVAAIMNAYAFQAGAERYRIRSEGRPMYESLLLSYFNNMLGNASTNAVEFRNIPSYQNKPIDNVAVVFNSAKDGGSAALVAPGYAITAEHVIWTGGLDTLSFDPEAKDKASSNLTVDIPIKVLNKSENSITGGEPNAPPIGKPLSGKYDIRVIRLQSPVNNIEPFDVSSNLAVGDGLALIGFDSGYDGTPGSMKFQATSKLVGEVYENAIVTEYAWGGIEQSGVSRGMSGGPALNSKTFELVGVVNGPGQNPLHFGATSAVAGRIDVEYITREIGKDVISRKTVNVGDAKFYFSYLAKGGNGDSDNSAYPKGSRVPLAPNSRIRTWLGNNAGFIKDALKSRGSRVQSALVGDTSDDNLIDSDDRTTLAAAIETFATLDDVDERNFLLRTGDLNKNGVLDTNDTVLLDKLIADYDEALDPVSIPDEIVAPQNRNTRISPLANDELPRGAGAIITDFTQPSNGTLIRDPAAPNSRFLYTPNAGMATLDRFSYTVTDRLGFSSTSYVSIAPTVPAAPNSFKVAAKTNNSVTLTWRDNSNNETAFRIAISRDNGETWDNVAVTEPNATSVEIRNLTASTKYLFKMRAANAGGYSNYTGVIPVETLPGPPAAPTNFRKGTIWQEAVQLAWDYAGSNAQSFVIWKSTDDGANWELAKTVASSVVNTDVTGLTMLTTYRFKIVARNAGGDSAAVISEPITTRDLRPTAPVDFRQGDAYPFSLQVGWTDTSSSENGFALEVSSDGGNHFTRMMTVGRNAVKATITGLNHNTTYVVRVIAYNQYGESSPLVSPPVTTKSAIPLDPSDVRIVDVDRFNVQFGWTDRSTNEDGYRVYKSTNGGQSYALAGSFTANSQNVRVENLEHSTTYVFKVVAYNQYGESNGMVTSPVTTKDARPEAPTDPRIGDVNYFNIQVGWTDRSATETGFRIYQSTDGGNSYVRAETNPSPIAANATQGRLINLQHNTTYTIKVVAFNDYGESVPLLIGNVKTLDAAPQIPTGLVAQTIWSHTIQFAWNDTNGGSAQVQLWGSSNNGASWTLYGTASPGENRLRAEGLSASTPYVFKVRAVNAFGTSGDSDVVVAFTKLAAPTDLRVATIRSTNVDLNWNDNSSDENQFIVYLSTNGTDFVEVKREVANRVSSRISGLKPNTRYWVKVAGTNDRGSVDSNVLEILTKSS